MLLVDSADNVRALTDSLTRVVTLRGAGEHETCAPLPGGRLVLGSPAWPRWKLVSLRPPGPISYLEHAKHQAGPAVPPEESDDPGYSFERWWDGGRGWFKWTRDMQKNRLADQEEQGRYFGFGVGAGADDQGGLDSADDQGEGMVYDLDDPDVPVFVWDQLLAEGAITVAQREEVRRYAEQRESA